MPRVKKEKEEKKETKQEERTSENASECGCDDVKSKVSKKEKKPRVNKDKIKRKPSEYALFIKQFYHTEEVQAVPPKERFGLLAKKCSQHKEKKENNEVI